MVEAIERSFASRFPQRANSGRRPVSTRVWLALEWLTHAVGASDAAIGERWRTDLALMSAWGLEDVQLDRPQAHGVLPETLAQCRSRLDAALLDELLAIQAAAAMAEGLVSPAHRLIETLPSAPGSPRVTDATTLYTAQQKASHS